MGALAFRTPAGEAGRGSGRGSCPGHICQGADSTVRLGSTLRDLVSQVTAQGEVSPAAEGGFPALKESVVGAVRKGSELML